MNLIDVLKITDLMTECPNCGNKYVGKGQGTIEVKGERFKRTCKCGFIFEYEVKKEFTEEDIKNGIQKSLRDMENKSKKEGGG